MTTEQKQIWAEMRTRFKTALSDKSTILKQDMVKCHTLHLQIFGKPKHRPTINCCIDIDAWMYMIKNLNKEYVKKVQ